MGKSHSLYQKAIVGCFREVPGKTKIVCHVAGACHWHHFSQPTSKSILSWLSQYFSRLTIVKVESFPTH